MLIVFKLFQWTLRVYQPKIGDTSLFFNSQQRIFISSPHLLYKICLYKITIHKKIQIKKYKKFGNSIDTPFSCLDEPQEWRHWHKTTKQFTTFNYCLPILKHSQSCTLHKNYKISDKSVVSRNTLISGRSNSFWDMVCQKN